MSRRTVIDRMMLIIQLLVSDLAGVGCLQSPNGRDG